MQFDEEKHEYTLGGNTFTSTTQLLKKYGLSADYTGIPDAVLQQAANKGKAVHKALELYIGGDRSMLGLLDEVDLFDNYVKVQNINLGNAKSEEVVYDTQYRIAGTVDFQYIDGSDVVIADFKTTSTLHLDSVAWQLSIYNYLVSKGDIMTYYFNKLKVFHFVNGKLYVKDVYTINYDTVKALFEANLNNDPVFNYVKSTKVITDSDSLLVKQLLTEIEIYESVIKKLDSELNIVLERVKENMIKQKDYSVRTPEFSIVYVGPVHRKSLNTKKVKEFLIKHGEKVDDYMNETISKDSVRARLLTDVSLNDTDKNQED